MKKISFILFTATLVCGCTADNGYTFKGQFKDAEADSVWLMDENLEVIASVPCTDGNFTFTGSAENPAIRVVSTDRFGNKPGCVFIMEPGQIVMTNVLDSFYVSNGTKANDAFSEFMKLNYEIRARISANGNRATNDLIAMMDSQEQMLKDGLMNNLDNYYGLFCLENLASEDDPQSTRIFLDRFSGKVKKYDAWKSISDKVDKLLNFGVGKPYMDFTQYDPDGKPITASAVMADPGNRYVLIDFWASWCGPCMSELPYLREAYSRYSDKGFEILGVSLDREREDWLKAIKEEDMNWLHVSDVQYWNNEVARLYNIQSIPANFLVDCKTGIIIEKGLRGANLVNKLAELLK